MRRREFIALISGVTTAWPLAVCAQQSERIRRIGVLQGLAENDPEGQDRFDALLHALQQLGWTDGRNIHIIHRFTNGDTDRARAYPNQLANYRRAAFMDRADASGPSHVTTTVNMHGALYGTRTD